MPILPDTPVEEAERVRALIAVGGPDDQALAAAYEADASALAFLAETQRGPTPALDGFLDAVMAEVAKTPREQPSAPVQREESEERAPAPILRPVFGVQLVIALAAMMLGGLGLAILAFDEAPRGTAPIVAGQDDPSASAPVPSEPAPSEPVADPSGQAPVEAPTQLAAPNRQLRRGMRPRGAQRPGAIVPVDGGRRRSRMSDPLNDVLRRVWQMQQQRDLQRLPPLDKDEREVKF
ncbi:MAG TPA: hypothetical protein DEA08_29815 [Planctomycetes bacterium]|nr:hypothetical protein [Planctomycetota bacterium]